MPNMSLWDPTLNEGKGGWRAVEPSDLGGTVQGVENGYPIQVVVPSTDGPFSATGVTGLVDVGEFPCEGARVLAITFAVTNSALTGFVVQGKVADAGGLVTLASVSADYTNPYGPILGASGDLTVAGTAVTHFLKVDCEGFYSIVLRASGAASGISGHARVA